MTKPVTQRRIAIAGERLTNAHIAAVACREASLPYFAACALLEKESGGRNVYGSDRGGVLSGFDKPVTRENFEAFWHEVGVQGRTSNGVGPCQITYRGYFPQMGAQGLRAWLPHDNMLFGFRLLKGNYDRTGSWEKAGAIYNGGPKPNADARAYGRDFAAKVTAWMKRLEI